MSVPHNVIQMLKNTGIAISFIRGIGIKTIGAYTMGNFLNTSPLQKIPQQIMPMLSQNRFRMKLYAFNIKLFVAHTHDFIQFARCILSPGGYFQAIGQGGLFDDQGMVTGGGERINKPFEHTEIMMINMRGFAVHDVFGVDDMTAKGIAYALMAETNAQNRSAFGKL